MTNWEFLELVNNWNLGSNVSAIEILNILAIISGLLVITASNPIISILFLIALFINVSVYLIFLGITFIGYTYIIVYVGAVTILFMYVIMLLDIQISELTTENNNNRFPLGILIGVGFCYPIINIINKPNPIYDIFSSISDNITGINNTTVTINKLSTVWWDSALTSTSVMTPIGNIMYTNYLATFILVSLILLLSMVGAITLTLNRNN